MFTTRCHMTTQCPYSAQIELFLTEEYHVAPANSEARFEALSRLVIGTKQLRNGPAPGPEQQVEIRKVLRLAEEERRPLDFFVPWASSKQEADARFDLLDFASLKQLAALQQGITRLGYPTPNFTFRVEDLADVVALGPDSLPRVEAYRRTFTHFASQLGRVLWESKLVKDGHFFSQVNALAPRFLAWLGGKDQGDYLARLGWQGGIPARQRDYYAAAFRRFYPDQDPLIKLAQYYAVVLSRKTLGMEGRPAKPYIHVYFGNPVPGDPSKGNALFYRSLPERYTHKHQPPWLGNGYLTIADDGYEVTVIPKIRGYGEEIPGLVPNAAVIEGHEVQCPYVLV